MPVVRTIDVPDRHFAILERFGHEMTGPAGFDPFANSLWTIRVNGRPWGDYASFDVQLGRVDNPTRLPQPIICPPGSRFTVEYNLKAGAPAGNYTGDVRVTGWYFPVQMYGAPLTGEQFSRGL